MRTTKYTLNGVEYTLAFTAAVMAKYEEENGKPAMEVLGAIAERNQVGEMMKLFYELMCAGASYERLHGREANDIAFDDLMAEVGIDDFAAVGTAIAECVGAGTSQNVKVDAGKKQNASVTT